MGVGSDNSASPITQATINISPPPTEGEEDLLLSEGGGGAAVRAVPSRPLLAQSFHSLLPMAVTVQLTWQRTVSPLARVTSVLPPKKNPTLPVLNVRGSPCNVVPAMVTDKGAAADVNDFLLSIM